MASHTGRTAVVCGASAGIGHGVALALAKAGMSVTVTGRDPERGAAVVASLAGPGPHEFVQTDGSLVKNAAPLAAAWAARHPGKPLDVLVLTQGIATMQGYTPTKEGLDQKLAVHYFGRLALLSAFLPALRTAPSPRVLTVLSGGVHSGAVPHETDFTLSKGYSLQNAANAAGLYNDVMVDALADDPANKGMLFVHAAPGIVNSRWGSDLPWYLSAPIACMKPLIGRSIQACGEIMAKPLLEADSVVAARVAAGGRPGLAEVMDANGKPGVFTKEHQGAKASVWRQSLEVLAKIESGGAI